MSESSLSKLEANLAEDLAWRKKEIVALRSAAKGRAAIRDFVCRAGSVVLCAHWEGYLRSSVQAYIDFVFSFNLKIRDLSPNFVAVMLYKDIKAAAMSEYPGSAQHCVKFSRRILQGVDILARKPAWKVETGGNPSSDITVRLLRTVGVDEQLGLSDAEWAATKAFIDGQLLKDRHKIAHGEGLPISSEVFLQRADRLLDMCDRITAVILRAAVDGTYRAIPIQSSN